MRRIEEIGSVFTSQNYSINSIITETLKKFNIKSLCYESGFKKDGGFSVTEIIVLAHDTDATPWTPVDLPLVLDHCRQKGYTFAVITEDTPVYQYR